MLSSKARLSNSICGMVDSLSYLLSKQRCLCYPRQALVPDLDLSSDVCKNIPLSVRKGHVCSWRDFKWILSPAEMSLLLLPKLHASPLYPDIHILCLPALPSCSHLVPLCFDLLPTPWASPLCPGAHTVSLSTLLDAHTLGPSAMPISHSPCVSALPYCSFPGPLCLVLLPTEPAPAPLAHSSAPFLAALLDLRGNNGSGDVIYQKNYFPVFHALYLSQKKSDQNLSVSGTLFNVNNLHNAQTPSVQYLFGGDYSILQTSEAFTRAYREAAIVHTS